MFVHVFPAPIISTTWFVIYIILHSIFFACNLETKDVYFSNAVPTLIMELIAIFGIAILHSFFCTIKYWKHIPGKFNHKFVAMLLFPLFVALYIPLSYKALFSKDVKWEAIPHTESKKIEELENEIK